MTYLTQEQAERELDRALLIDEQESREALLERNSSLTFLLYGN